MFIRRKFFWSLVTFTILAVTAFLFGHSKSIGQKIRSTSGEPTVNASDSESSDPKRQAKGRRYDKPKSGAIIELPPDVEELPLNSHWWNGIPALPVAESDAIVVGDVLEGTAHLSNNRSVVYCEFSVQLKDILKNVSSSALNVGQTIIAERLGGAVRFPSGKIQHYRVSKQGIPRTNEKYILFLKCNGEDYDIVTGYWINNDQVKPLDGDGDLQFAKYEGKSVDSFLNELRQAINAALPKGIETK